MPSHEHEARRRKAVAISSYIWLHMPREMRNDPQTAWGVQDTKQDWRDGIAAAAGQRSPSEATWAIVVERVAFLVNAVRQGAPAPCTECHGHGEKATSPDPERDRPHQCPKCAGTGSVLCECCSEEVATVVVPLGFYGPACARAEYLPLAAQVVALSVQYDERPRARVG